MAKFRDPIDEEADVAEGSSIAKHSQDLADRMASRPSAEPEEVEVQEPDDDEEEELADAKASRKDKRAARVSARERAAAAEARAQVLAEQLEITRRSNAERQQAPQRGGNPVAEIDGRIKSVNKRLADIHEEWRLNQGKLTKEREQELIDKAEALEVEKLTAVVERREALVAPARERAAQVQALRMRAPDVYDSGTAMAYAQARYKERTDAGEKDSLELHDAVMEEARQVILGKRPKPDAAQRQRAAGIGGGPRASIGGERPKVAMTKGSPLYRLACAQYPHLDPGEACQKWANKHGKEYLSRTGR